MREDLGQITLMGDDGFGKWPCWFLVSLFLLCFIFFYGQVSLGIVQNSLTLLKMGVLHDIVCHSPIIHSYVPFNINVHVNCHILYVNPIK